MTPRSNRQNSVHRHLQEAVKAARRVFRDIPPQVLWRQAEELMAFLLQVDRATLLVKGGEALNAGQIERWRKMVQAWVRGVPIQRITGIWGFWSLRELEVPEGVFIPRPETEVLIEAVLEWFPDRQRAYAFCDAGTGCGALALALAQEYPRARVYAVDISPIALRATQNNVRRYRLQQRVFPVQSDWFTAFRRGPLWDAVVANPPYISARDWGRLPTAVQCYEPREALVPPRGPARLYQSLARHVRARLKPRGVLVVEVGFRQADAVRTWLQRLGGNIVGEKKDLLGVVRCLVWQPDRSGGPRT